MYNPEKSRGIPGPLAVLKKTRDELSEAFKKKGTNDHGIGHLIRYTVVRFGAGFLAASVVAILLGVAIGLSPMLYRALNPFIQVLKPISPLAWMPLLLYTVQHPTWTAILVVFLASLWPTVANTAFGVSSIRKDYLQVASLLQLSWGGVFSPLSCRRRRPPSWRVCASRLGAPWWRWYQRRCCLASWAWDT